MKTKTSLLISGFLLINLGCFADDKALGERTGQLTTKIARSEPQKNLLAKRSTPVFIYITVNRTIDKIPVELKASRQIVEEWRDGKKERVIPLIEFAVESKGQTSFNWSCWESANASPHDFKVSNDSVGNTYASYVSIEGIKLFRIAAANDPEMTRQAFLEKKTPLGELPTLRTSFLHSVVGKESFLTRNALYDAITVDNIIEADGTVRVTLHGNNPAPQFTFELKNGEWRKVENNAPK